MKNKKEEEEGRTGKKKEEYEARRIRNQGE